MEQHCTENDMHLQYSSHRHIGVITMPVSTLLPYRSSRVCMYAQLDTCGDGECLGKQACKPDM
jgi:hypothetical protein